MEPYITNWLNCQLGMLPMLSVTWPISSKKVNKDQVAESWECSLKTKLPTNTLSKKKNTLTTHTNKTKPSHTKKKIKITQSNKTTSTKMVNSSLLMKTSNTSSLLVMLMIALLLVSTKYQKKEPGTNVTEKLYFLILQSFALVQKTNQSPLLKIT